MLTDDSLATWRERRRRINSIAFREIRSTIWSNGLGRAGDPAALSGSVQSTRGGSAQDRPWCCL